MTGQIKSIQICCSMPVYHFIWTLNNYTPEDILRIQGCIGKRGIRYICYGREVAPSTGTPHLQGYMQSTQKQYERLQLAFAPTHLNNLQSARAASGPNAAEISGQFAEPYTAIGYCMKDGDFYETGMKETIAAVADRQGQRTDLKNAMAAIDNNADDTTMYGEHYEVMAKYPKFVANYRNHVQSEAGKQFHKDKLSNLQLYPWQEAIIQGVTAESTERTIYWVWSDAGNMGKSVFSKYLGLFHDALVFESGKKNDIHYIFSKNRKRIVAIDFARSTKVEHMEHFYSIAETLKNGVMTVGKYDGDVIWFVPPHIIFFANFGPDHSKWSEDRLVEMKLD